MRERSRRTVEAVTSITLWRGATFRSHESSVHIVEQRLLAQSGLEACKLFVLGKQRVVLQWWQEAVAAEFEASAPQDREPGYLGPLTTMPIDAPFTPTPGEAQRVIAQAASIAAQLFDMRIVLR